MHTFWSDHQLINHCGKLHRVLGLLFFGVACILRLVRFNQVELADCSAPAYTCVSGTPPEKIWCELIENPLVISTVCSMFACHDIRPRITYLHKIYSTRGLR